MMPNRAACSLVSCWGLCLAAWCGAEEGPEKISVNAQELTVGGQAWPGEGGAYGRLPARLEGRVPAMLWELGKHSAGLTVQFVSDGASVGATWTQPMSAMGLPNITGIARGGMDLYVYEGDQWLWVGQATPKPGLYQGEWCIEGLEARLRRYMLYLPLFSQVEDVKVWIMGKPARIGKIPPAQQTRRAPLVFYGTSVTQGVGASRPGLTYSAIVGRKLDRPVYNLGFGGQGHIYTEMAELLGELEPAAYVVEGAAGMAPAEAEPPIGSFVRTLRAARPQTPIILVESPLYRTERRLPDVAEQDSLRKVRLRVVLQQLAAEGVEGLYFIEGESLVYPDGEGQIDGVHPNDLGMALIAERVMAVLARALKD